MTRFLFVLLALWPALLPAQDTSHTYTGPPRIDSIVHIHWRRDTLRLPGRVDTVRVPGPIVTPPPPPPKDTVIVVPVPIPGTKLLVGAQKPFDSRSNPVPARYLVNAASASWTGQGSNPINWAGGKGGSWLGGTITGTWNQATTPWSTYHSTGGLHVRVDSAVVSGLRVKNFGDPIRFNDPVIKFFTLRDSWFSDIHDDGFENDWLKAGLVEDNLFDSVTVGFSIRPGTEHLDSVDGHTRTLTLRRNLIRLAPVAFFSDYTDAHGGFIKAENRKPEKNVRLVFEGNIFRADRAPKSGDFRLNPHGIVTRSVGNTFVWTGPGACPCLPLAPGWTLTTDPKVWDDGVVAWKARHP